MTVYRMIRDHVASSDGELSVTANMVFEADRMPIATGIISAEGTPIYRMPELRRIGFDLRPRVRVRAASRRMPA